ncbi:MAG: hypothetical protein D9C04_06510 [Nitrosopumilus sp. B06]|nr:MAG: hypothetical protein EB828_03585 [Nitrosopumilus sp. D6]RNJ78827.1 MAG: hypothetical protein D9C04_06510 [Nitrosopumilus sp. B06]
MTISEENRDFISSLIDYYISESASYRQIAGDYSPEIESVPDTAFGIIVGCIYAGFLQACQNQQLTPGLEEMQELGKMIKAKAPLIKKSILDPGQEDKS